MAINFRRIPMALVSGYQQALRTYRQEDFVAEVDFKWDDYPQRLSRYWHNRRYADNTIYTAVNAYLSLFKNKEKLYKNIRGLRNPVHRLVQIETSKVLGGDIDFENFKEGAIRVKGADERLMQALRTLLTWSNFETMKNPFIRMGSTMGDVCLKIVDDIERQKVRLEVLDPRKVQDVVFDAVGNVKEVTICYLKTDRETGVDYEYKEIIDNDFFVIYHGNNIVDDYPNPYGFVPVRWNQHINVGRDFGEASFHNSRSKIDNLNNLVSQLHANLGVQAMPKFSLNASGLPKQDSTPSTINMSVDSEDKAPIVPIGEDSELKPIVYNADISAGLDLCVQLQNEIEADLPQLALRKMRDETGNASGVAIENLYSDSLDVIAELQGNYMASLKAALQMGISIAAYRGYDDFRGYSLDSYNRGVIDFSLRAKEVMKDNLTTKERLDMTMQAAKSEASTLILEQLGYDNEDILKVEENKSARAREQFRAAFDGMFQDNQAQNPQNVVE